MLRLETTMKGKLDEMVVYLRRKAARGEPIDDGEG
jgi:hypothetical protein